MVFAHIVAHEEVIVARMTDGLDIMPRSHAITTEFVCQIVEQAELKVAIATHTGVGRAPLSVFVEEILDNGSTKSVAHIHHMVLDAQLLGQAARTCDKVGRITALGKLAGEVVNAHRHSHHFIPLLLKQKADGGTIHSARHRHQYSVVHIEDRGCAKNC